MTAMNSRLRSFAMVATLLIGFILGGCFGGKVPQHRSERLQKAETALSRGTRAEQKGNLTDSAAHFTEALSESTAIEDYVVRVTSLINLARLYRTQHDLVRAEQYLDQVLALKSETKSLLAEIYYEKSLLELAKGRIDSALVWADQSVSAETGNQLGCRLNLTARIHLELGNLPAAQSRAQQALQENRAAGHLEEEANSLRILGIVGRFTAHYTEGEAYLKAALALDKKLGKSGKIAMDLEELGAICVTNQNLTQASVYLERAREIHIASGRRSSAQKNLETLADIHDRMGDPNVAEKYRTMARELSAVGDSTQTPQKSSVTINPSNKP